MRNRILKYVACAMSALLTVVSVPMAEMQQNLPKAVAASVVSNPIIWADVPDVDVIRVGDTYYMVSTTMYFSPGAPIMKSKDLVSWEICNYVYDTYADGDVQNLTNGKHDYAHGQWATSLRYHNGTYYVFFGSYGSGKSYIYQTKDIENGTWTRSEINGMYHDASILFDDDGRNYLVYGGGGEIKIKELNAEMTGFKSGGAEKTLFKTGLDGLSGEGAHIQKIGDYYYVFIIAWPSGSGRIELCYRSKELLGTYEGKTVLNSGVGSYGSGVAQGGIVDTPDGKWYGMLFQDHGSVGRIPVLVPVSWQDNWPMMGVNGKVPVTLTVDGDFTGTQLAVSDDFSYDANKLALEWQWNHNPDHTAWSVTERAGYLRLTNKTLANHLLNARNTLTQRTEGPACSSVIKLDTKGMKVGDYAGLSAFQFKYGNVGVYVADDGSKKIYMSNNGGYSGSSAVTDSYDRIVEQVNLNGDTIYLKVDFLFNNITSDGSSSNNIDKANFYYSYDGNSWTKIGEELSMVYDLKLFTGYRSGIYSYATKSTGGYADIDSFSYSRADWNLPTVVEPDANGYFFHSTFEGDLDSWQGRGDASLMTSGRVPYQGAEALLVQERTAAWNGAMRPISANAFRPGNAYSFSVCARYVDGAPTQLFYLKLQYVDAEGTTQYSTIAEATAVKDSYVQLANTDYVIPADATDMQIYVETADNTMNFYIDEAIGAVAGTVVEGPAAVQLILGDVNCDGMIGAADLSAAKQGVRKGAFASSVAELAADVDQSGAVDATDVQLICDYITMKITEFPVAERQGMRPMSEYTPIAAATVVETEPASSHNEVAGRAYGTVQSGTYYSTTCNRNKPYNILLPAGYSESKQYPVLYVMHGYWENQDRMILTGNGTMYTRQIIGNAIAEGAAEDMIVVFPYIYSSATQDSCNAMDDANNAAYDNFINDLTKDLMPHIESTYSVKTGRENTAITGFSMGGREALLIGMQRADLFGYVGSICAAPGVTGSFQWNSEAEAPSLLFMTAGSNDTVVYSSPEGYHNSFTSNGVPHIWHYVNGGYHGDNSIHAHIYNFVRVIFKA
ncbi:MAG: glycoside hydrolase family 43 [Ruminococcus sp.]|nr:glycoside hydrolase family 43 [Ruminococcus sp.]